VHRFPTCCVHSFPTRLLQVVCPVASSLAPQKVAVHWVNSDEALDLIPKPNKRWGNYRMQPVIPAVCNASNIKYWARMGTAIYGSYLENFADPVEGSGTGTAPALRWTSKVQSVGGCFVYHSVLAPSLADSAGGSSCLQAALSQPQHRRLQSPLTMSVIGWLL
jgi:hypothetical protein